MSEYVEGRLLAKLKSGVDIDDIREIIPSAKVLGTPGGIHLISFEDSPVIDEVKRLEESGLVEYAQPDHVYNAFLPTPYHSNDPYYADGNQWALFNQGQNGGVAGADIRAPYAWRILYESGKPIGSSAVKVGVIDTGVDYNHPDLSGNCKKSDGFDFYNTDADPMDDGDHGTHVAGIIGATGNNGTGVSGVAWACRIYPIKALNSSMQATDTTILYSLDHADMVGCHIVNMSFGSYSFSQAVANAIAGMAGVLFVCGAGNDASDNDSSPVYPASLGFNNIISVCNTNNKDQLNAMSNYGATSVHVGAPGSNICSTFPGGIYLWMSGTSMAAPVVTGIAVLLKAAFPELTVAQIRNQILNNVDVIPALSGKCSTGGRVNAYKAFSGLLVDPEVQIGTRSQCAIRDAQNDGEYYARMNGAWVKIPIVEYTAGEGVLIDGSEIGLSIFDESGIISADRLPSSLTGSLIYKGGFDPTVASPSPAAQGWYFIAVASGEVAGVQFYENDWIVYRDEYAFDKISNSSSSVMWGNVVGKPETYPPVVGETSTDAYRGDRGAVAYSHALSPHAPANAQKNSDITKEEIEAKLTGEITSHNHGETYSLPTASESVLGGVKVGSRLTITDGVLSADEQGGSYILPTASADVLGGVKIGSGITITDGVISTSGGGGTWGSIAGTLSDQTDLDTALSGKATKTASDLTLYVYEDATGDADGSSKANAYTTLQAAIDAIPDIAQNVTVIVCKGSTNYLGQTTTIQKASVKSLTIQGEFYAYEACDANAVAGKVVDADIDTTGMEVGDRVVCTKYSGTVGASSIEDYFYATITEVGSGYVQTSEETKVPTTGWRYLINQTVFDGNNGWNIVIHILTPDLLTQTLGLSIINVNARAIAGSPYVNRCIIYDTYGISANPEQGLIYNSAVFIPNNGIGGALTYGPGTLFVRESLFATISGTASGIPLYGLGRLICYYSGFFGLYKSLDSRVSTCNIYCSTCYIDSSCTYGAYGYNITLVDCTNNAATPVYNLTSGGSIEEWDGEPLPSIADATGGQVLALKSDKSALEFATVASSYTLPTASVDTLGGVKIGDNLSIDGSGVLSAVASPYELPTASVDVKGGVKVGSRLTITDGVLSADEQGGGLVKVSSNDTTAGYLLGKLVAGANITLTEGADGGNETLTIVASGSGGAGGYSTLVQRSLEGVVYETTLMYWMAPATCIIDSCSMSLSSNPSATGNYCKVQVMKNGTLETNSIFSADTPMQITELTSASNGIYTASGTLDSNQTTLASGDVIQFRVNQADTGSADLLVQMKVAFT